MDEEFRKRDHEVIELIKALAKMSLKMRIRVKLQR
jgi:hypothetical protein